MRLALSLATLLFLFTICTLMIQDRAILVDLWLGSSILFSLVYLIGIVSCSLGVIWLIHWKLRPALWRDDSAS
jgi:cell division protein FtsL